MEQSWEADGGVVKNGEGEDQRGDGNGEEDGLGQVGGTTIGSSYVADVLTISWPKSWVHADLHE